MELVIREVHLSEIELVATFLFHQFEKEFEGLHLKQDKIIQLLTQAMKCEQCFIALLDEYEILEIARTGVTGLSRGAEDVIFL